MRRRTGTWRPSSRTLSWRVRQAVDIVKNAKVQRTVRSLGTVSGTVSRTLRSSSRMSRRVLRRTVEEFQKLPILRTVRSLGTVSWRSSSSAKDDRSILKLNVSHFDACSTNDLASVVDSNEVTRSHATSQCKTKEPKMSHFWLKRTRIWGC